MWVVSIAQNAADVSVSVLAMLPPGSWHRVHHHRHLCCPRSWSTKITLQSSPAHNHNVWHKAGAGAVSGLVAPPLAAAGWSLCLTVSGAAAAVLPGCWLARAATAEAAPHSSISIRPPTKYFSGKIFIYLSINKWKSIRYLMSMGKWLLVASNSKQDF